MTAKRGGLTFDNTGNCVRGLETLIDSRLSRRELCEKKALRKAIKIEEHRQKEENTFPDFKKFRSVSLQHTKGSTERATLIANEDAKIVCRTNSLVGDVFNRRSPLARLQRSSSASCAS